LIAIRGEIAVRIIKTAKRLGLPTVAVYSDADEASLAVAMADEAVRIGPAPAAQSYLRIDAILEAMASTGADAVHPGFGFLSENADFARAVEAAGKVFVGPNVRAIEAMGDKIASKALAEEAGVNVIPGAPGAIADAKAAEAAAKEIGFPVMLKASAGGGGKGMRVARNAKEVREGFSAAASEAQSSFGDGRILIEKFVEEPRHIEIQVLGDKHGGLVHLGERECSIQRRNQKVIEEAPSAFLTPKVRKAMAEQALALAAAVDYDSAGTVEFIVDKSLGFYFLEMNTRLQVEHPVTELITGVDLVEEMLKSASGAPLGLKQSEIKPQGWAMEARLYAEDPTRGFLPSIGRLKRFRPPTERTVGGRTVRVDAGVREGDEVSVNYDPMIAKVVSHGADRAAAIETLANALDELEVEGVENNATFLSAVLAQERFAEARLSTGYIDEEFKDGFAPIPPEGEDRALFAAVAAYAGALTAQRADARGEAARTWAVAMNGDIVEAQIELEPQGASVIMPGRDRPHALKTDWRPGRAVMRGRLDDASFIVKISPTLEGWRLERRGAVAFVQAGAPPVMALRARLPEKTSAVDASAVTSPMPGLVVSIAVEEGAQVKPGEPLLVLEAMKMENVIRAHREGEIKKLCVAAGAHVAADDVLLEFR
jgi:propionyl-CoA carboxylase alpha chain